jgi:putative pyruvate formate lyase activating enzyme
MEDKSRVNRALDWYYGVIQGRYPPKFKIARSLPIDVDPTTMSDEELWLLHGEMEAEFRKRLNEIKEEGASWKTEDAFLSYLDLKVEILKRMLTHCEFCERKCGTNRLVSKGKYCRVDYRGQVSSFFLHYGEEYPLVPSGTIFYSGCNFRCVYCQNFEISQLVPLRGMFVDARMLASMEDRLIKEGAKNINHVGGEPTPHAHVILESFKYMREAAPQIWNSNFYMSEKLTRLLKDVIDLWLPDFKYWEPSHASSLSAAPRYRDVVTRNLLTIRWEGSIILRHLILPNHVDCCSIPIMKWLSEKMPKEWLVVNVMDQYYPTYRVVFEGERWGDLKRRITREEYETVVNFAKREGILLI